MEHQEVQAAVRHPHAAIYTQEKEVMESDSVIGEVVLLVLAMGVYGVCDAAEVALLAAQKSRILAWKNAGKRRAAVALQMCEAPERFLATLQIIRTFVVVLAGVVAGVVAVYDVTPWLAAAWSLRGMTSWTPMVALVLVMVVLTYVVLLFGQLIPKAIALQYPEFIVCWVAQPLRTATRLFGMARALLTVSLTVILWLIGQRRPPSAATMTGVVEATTGITEEAITAMVREGADRGIFEEVEHELIEGVFEFTDTAVREIMVPRVRIQALEIKTTREEVLCKVSEFGHSRVPVYSGDLDHMVGVLYLKDLLRVVSEQAPWDLQNLLRMPLFVPETAQISQLLRTLQQRRLTLAIVVDEHGGVAGLVTVKDLLEQLVGEISEEGETEDDVLVTPLPDGSWAIQGSAPLWELREQCALPVEETSEYHTLAGLLLARLGRIPQGGESIVEQGYSFTVADVDGPRIVRIKVEPCPPEEDLPVEASPEGGRQQENRL
jgi:putative hemolysin